MVKLLIVRHGYSEFNKARKFCGQFDAPLTEQGREQAKVTAKYVLKNYRVDKVYSSDSSRAYDTVKPIADALGLPVITSEKLRELHVGKWEGIAFYEVEKLYPSEYRAWVENVGESRPVGGESYLELQTRGYEELRRIALENDGKTLVIGTHGGLIRALRCKWHGLDIKNVKELKHVSNASVTEVDFDVTTGEAKLIKEGYDEHLSGLVTSITIT